MTKAAAPTRRARTRAALPETLFDTPLYLAPGESLESIRQAASQLRGDPLDSRAFFSLFFSSPDSESTADGIAIVRVVGSLFRGMFWDDYKDIRERVDAAVADGNVRAIVLDIDSPGGRVAGLMDLTRYLYDLRASIEKPIWALANDQATSAAYAIASAAARLFVTPAGIVGSIGALCTHLDLSESDRELGLKYTEVASGSAKTDLSPHKPLNARGRGRLQKIVDEAAEMLFAEVALYRSALSVDALREQQASIYVGLEAAELGLVDGVANLEQLLEQLRAELDGVKDPARGARVPKTSSAAQPAGESQMNPPNTDPGAAAAPSQQPSQTTQAAPAAAPAAVPAAVPTPAAAAANPAEAFQANARLITNACALAGRPELAGEMIATGQPIEAVQQKLLQMRAQADADPVQGHIPQGRPSTRTIDTNAVYKRWNDVDALQKSAPAAR